MTIFLFVFIAWIIIGIFSNISKNLDITENFITFFCVTIVVLNISTITDMNLHLMSHSNKPELFFSFWIHRNIIMPLCLLVFVNATIFLKMGIKKIIIGIAILAILCLIEGLTVWTGVKTYTGWNLYLVMLTSGILMIFSNFLAKMVKKIK